MSAADGLGQQPRGPAPTECIPVALQVLKRRGHSLNERTGPADDGQIVLDRVLGPSPRISIPANPLLGFKRQLEKESKLNRTLGTVSCHLLKVCRERRRQLLGNGHAMHMRGARHSLLVLLFYGVQEIGLLTQGSFEGV